MAEDLSFLFQVLNRILIFSLTFQIKLSMSFSKIIKLILINHYSYQIPPLLKIMFTGDNKVLLSRMLKT